MKIPMFAPKAVAYAVDQSLAKPKLNVVDLFRSLERDHQLWIKTSVSGVEVRDKDDTLVYQNGVYAERAAEGAAECAEYRLKICHLLYWAADHYPTPELKRMKEWANE